MVTSCQSWLEHNVTPQSFQLDGSEWVTRYYDLTLSQDIDAFTRWGSRCFQIPHTSIDKILQNIARYYKIRQDTDWQRCYKPLQNATSTRYYEMLWVFARFEKALQDIARCRIWEKQDVFEIMQYFARYDETLQDITDITTHYTIYNKLLQNAAGYVYGFCKIW